jgi:hypothetical protein
MINVLRLGCGILLVSGVLGQLDPKGADLDNYGCAAPNNLGCFPNGALTCVNPLSNPNNCGGCAQQCPLSGTSGAAKCTATGLGTKSCQCPTGSKQCGSGNGVCNTISMTTCSSDCTTGCTTPVPSTGVAGDYCLVTMSSTLSSTTACTSLVGCTDMVDASVGGTTVQPFVLTAAGSESISPQQCNIFCSAYYPTSSGNYFTLTVDGTGSTANTLCSCFTSTGGVSFIITTPPTADCTIGSDGISFYGRSTNGDGQWEVYNRF